MAEQDNDWVQLRTQLRASVLYIRPLESARSISIPPAARALLQQHAASGDGEAAYLLGLYLLYQKQETSDGLRWLKQAAALGGGDACIVLGDLYDTQSTSGLVPSDAAAAFSYYKTGAELGEKECYVDTARACLDGIGTEKDPAEAVRWLRKGVEAGISEAYALLGWCYLEGTGVPIDLEQGESLLLQCPDKERTRLALGALYAGMYDPSFVDLEKAEACYAPDLDDPGLCGQRLAALSNAAAVIGDTEKAHMYLLHAAEAGFVPAQELLDEESQSEAAEQPVPPYAVLAVAVIVLLLFLPALLGQ